MSDESRDEPIGYVTLPIYKLPPNRLASFRQQMLQAGPHGVSSTAGLGADAIWAEVDVDSKTATSLYRVHGRDVLAATLELTEHADAGAIPVTDGYLKQGCTGAFVDGALTHDSGTCPIHEPKESE